MGICWLFGDFYESILIRSDEKTGSRMSIFQRKKYGVKREVRQSMEGRDQLAGRGR